MQLLSGVKGFGASVEKMDYLCIVFCRSVLEQSCVVCGPSLTKENKEDLERTQNTFAKLVLREKYTNYENALTILNIDTLESRRNDLCLKFAQKGIVNGKLSDIFPENYKKHPIKTRIDDKYRVNFAKTDRLKHYHNAIHNAKHVKLK